MNGASTIGQGTLVRGSVRGEGDLEILGRVEGSVAVGGELSIGEGALVKSDVIKAVHATLDSQSGKQVACSV